MFCKLCKNHSRHLCRLQFLKAMSDTERASVPVTTSETYKPGDPVSSNFSFFEYSLNQRRNFAVVFAAVGRKFDPEISRI